MISFILSGGGVVLTKTMVSMHLEDYRGVYFLSLYGTKLLLALAGNIINRYIPSRKELTMGMIMGMGGMGNMYFILLALRGISGIVAFPLRTCGNLVFTVFVSFFIWNERITKLEIIGLVLASSSIIMINL